MPTYNFKCSSCGRAGSVVKKMQEDLPVCSDCGSHTEVVITSCNFILSGNGWSSKEIKSDRQMEKIL